MSLPNNFSWLTIIKVLFLYINKGWFPWDWAKYHDRHSSKNIWVIKLSFCQNDLAYFRCIIHFIENKLTFILTNFLVGTQWIFLNKSWKWKHEKAAFKSKLELKSFPFCPEPKIENPCWKLDWGTLCYIYSVPVTHFYINMKWVNPICILIIA